MRNSKIVLILNVIDFKQEKKVVEQKDEIIIIVNVQKIEEKN